MKYTLLLLLLLPTLALAALTKVTGALQESEYIELLANPSFEGTIVANTSVQGWTPGGTASYAAGAGIQGAQSLCFTAAAQTFTLLQDSSVNASAFADGTVQGILQLRLKTSHTGDITLCSRQAGTTSTTNCQTITATANGNKWAMYRIPFLFGATSQGISISAASGTGTTCVDDAKVGMAEDFDTVPNDTTWKTWTGATAPTNLGTGVGSYTYYRYRKSGTVLDLDIIWNSSVAGSGSSTILFPLPPGYTQSAVAAAAVAGSGVLSYYGVAGSATYVSSTILTHVSGLYPLKAGTGGGVTGADIGSAAQIRIRISVPLENQDATINTYTDQCQTDVQCANEFSVKGSTTSGTLSDESVDWINGNGTAANGTAITFNSGIFTVAPNCTVSPISSSNALFYISGLSSAGVTVNSINSATLAPLASQPFSLVCQKQGTDYKPRRQIVGSFKDTPKTIGSSGSDIQSVSFGATTADGCTTTCTTGFCARCGQVGSKITSVEWLSTGQYKFNGIDGTKYNCSTGGAQDSASTITNMWHYKAGSTSSYAVIRSLTGNNVHSASVTCTGIP